MLKRFIVVKNEIDGLHSYPDAPEEVSYLRAMHRHTFTIRVKMEVYGDNRELEFYMVKDRIAKALPAIFAESKSCEMYAEDIYNFLQKVYGDRSMEVAVGEDHDNEAIVTNF